MPLATSARPAPISIGLRWARVAPSRLAITAARISTASRPSRKTITAAFVTTVAVLAPSPSVPAPSSSASSSASRVSRTSRAGAWLAISFARPVVAVDPEPDERLDAARRRRARSSAGSARGRTRRTRTPRAAPARPGGTRRPPTAASRRSSVSSIRSKSDCESSSFHSSGKSSSSSSRGALVRLLDVVLGHDLAAARRRPRRSRSSSSSAASTSAVACGSRSVELALEVRERGGGAVAEGDRLLDLERDRHAAVVDAVAVLDRDQVEEADELGGAARLLLGREGCGDEALEHARRGVGGRREGVRVAQARAGELREGRVGLVARGRPARALVLGREDQPEPGRLRGGLGEPGVEAALLRPARACSSSADRLAW